MLPLIQELVLSRGWLSQEQLVDFVAVSESTPGPFAVNIATYIGERTAGPFGALLATLGVVLPSFVIILAVSGGYKKFKENRIVKGCMAGLRPAVIALIASAVWSVGGSVFHLGQIKAVAGLITAENLITLGIVAVAAVMAWKKCHPIAIICVSGVLGIVMGYLGV